jgi:hypothetical protein
VLFSWLSVVRPGNRQSIEKHNKYQFLYIYSIPPDDGPEICPKLVEVDWWNKLKINSASRWFSLHRITVCLSQFYLTWIFSTNFGKKKSSNIALDKVRPVGTELFHADGLTDTDRHAEAYSRFLQFCKRAYQQSYVQTVYQFLELIVLLRMYTLIQ